MSQYRVDRPTPGGLPAEGHSNQYGSGTLPPTATPYKYVQSTSGCVVALTPLRVGDGVVDMPSTEEARHGVGVCEDCGTIQPVEVRPDDGIRATGNPVCECGSNRFSLVE